MLSERSALREAVATFVTRAAEKLRNNHSVSGCVHVFLETNGHRQDLDQYVNAATLRLPVATAYTPMLLEAAMTCLEDVFREGYRYKRAGVLLLDVCSGDAVQQDLFSADDTLIGTFEDQIEDDPKDPAYKMKIVQAIRLEVGQLIALLEAAELGNEGENI